MASQNASYTEAQKTGACVTNIIHLVNTSTIIQLMNVNEWGI